MSLSNLRGDVAAFLLVALVVAAITVLAALRQPIPDVLTTVALVAVGAGGGAAVPRTTPVVLPFGLATPR